MSRPAIQWNDELVKAKQQTCGYWNVEFLLNLFSSDDEKKHPGNTQQHNDDADARAIVSLSYTQLLLVTSFVVAIIRQKIQTLLLQEEANVRSTTTESSSGSIAVPVVVAIPEGPFLPLAILAVHSLNVPFSIEGCGGTSEAYAVLIPIEPGEGKQRIRHMLADTRAAVVLCLEADRQCLADIVNSIEDIDDNGRTSTHNTCLFQSNAPAAIFNFAEIVLQAASEIRSLMEQGSGSQTLQDLLKRFTKMEQLQPGQCFERISGEFASSITSPNRISHGAFTSGSTGLPKGSFSSINALRCYIQQKNKAHDINHQSVVLLASTLSFDPCLSDIIATFEAQGTLGIATRTDLSQNLPIVLRSLRISHVLCTPTLWSTINNTPPTDFSFLRVIALGGEPIQKQILQRWARREMEIEDVEKMCCSLYATYGVTEACVYQTMGEITIPVANTQTKRRGQNVGKPFDGMNIRICKENDQEMLVDEGTSSGGIGEIVLCGSQLDDFSSYLNRPKLNLLKFVKEKLEDSSSVATEQSRVHYRTGDRGYIDNATGNLFILDRIGGEEGMVKINGVRVELGEIEAALIDNTRMVEEQTVSPVIVYSAVIARRNDEVSNKKGKTIELIAYCVLSPDCCSELGMNELLKEHSGVLCNSKPMLALLQTRCKENVRAGCTPSAFVFVSKVPISPTGKRNLAALPPLSKCILQENTGEEMPLKDYGSSGSFLADQISSNLNLQPCQQSMLTTAVSFSMLGGDSLAATRIVRAIYAHHHGLQDSRHLGGTHGTIDGAFSAVNLAASNTLREYVDFLDRSNICSSGKKRPAPTNEIVAEGSSTNSDNNGAASRESRLFDALMIATAHGHSSLAIALLREGADPNFGAHGGRLGKVSGRKKEKATFRSGPLHIASLHGEVSLVRELLHRGAKFTSPDAQGSFPLHLAASGENASKHQGQLENEHDSRLGCVKGLLEAGAPMYMKNSSRLSLIHCMARSGNCKLIDHIIPIWIEGRGDRDFRGSSLDWRDKWNRTGIHWTILNGHLDALRALLRHGCNPEPASFKESTKLSSIALESPMELCKRLHGTKEGIGLEIATILKAARVAKGHS